MLNSGKYDSEWAATTCVSAKKPFVCKRHSTCKFVYHSDKVNRTEAQSRCEADGMWLATLDCEKDVIAARKLIAEKRLEELNPCWETQTWIGLKGTYLGFFQARWNWVEDGSEADFTNWWQGNAVEPAEPSLFGPNFGLEMCVEMSLEGTWNDQLCECVPGPTTYY